MNLSSLPPSLLGLLLDFARLSLWLVLLCALFIPLERLFAQRPAKVLREGIWADVGYYVLNGMVGSLLLSMPLALLGTLAKLIIPEAVPAAIGSLPVWLRIVLSLVVGEFGFYWGHRLAHEVPLLWRFHAIHHSAPHVDFITNTRAHPLDMLVNRLPGMLLLYLLGLAGPTAVGTAMPVTVLLAGTTWGYFVHANVRWRFGPLEWLVSTPAFHHWHHSRVDHINHNYAAMLPFVDRLFGTYYLPKHWPDAYGLSSPIASGWVDQLIDPLLPNTNTQTPSAKN